jgi:hypothetical protein
VWPQLQLRLAWPTRKSSGDHPKPALPVCGAVRELAAVVLVLVKAVEAVVDVLGHQRVQGAPATTGWRYRTYDEFDEDEQR